MSVLASTLPQPEQRFLLHNVRWQLGDAMLQALRAWVRERIQPEFAKGTMSN